MNKLISRLVSSFIDIKSKIVFYPGILSTAGFLLALGMQVVENTGISNHLIDAIPQLAIESGDTARTILSVCIAGLISMMVFGFSMVMMVLNQAANNYSPRLLPELISDKRHQLILGLYLGAIMYNIFTLFTVHTTEEKYSLPAVSILIGIGLTIFSLISFIFFIHNVSQSIQINNILDGIFDTASKRLRHVLEEEDDKTIPENFPDTADWHEYTPQEPGYFQNVIVDKIVNIADQNKNRICIMKPKGIFIAGNMPFIRSEKELDQDTLDNLFSNIHFSRGELIETNYVLAFKQITEIIVKAMSPGINDPGTALNAIDYMTELFTLRMKKKDRDIYGKEGSAYVKLASVPFSELMYYTMASLRTYCTSDPVLVHRLIDMLQYLSRQDTADDRYLEVVHNELQAFTDQAMAHLSSAVDRDNILLRVEAKGS